MKKTFLIFAMFSLMLVLTSFTTPTEIGGGGKQSGGEIAYEIGGGGKQSGGE